MIKKNLTIDTKHRNDEGIVVGRRFNLGEMTIEEAIAAIKEQMESGMDIQATWEPEWRPQHGKIRT